MAKPLSSRALSISAFWRNCYSGRATETVNNMTYCPPKRTSRALVSDEAPLAPSWFSAMP